MVKKGYIRALIRFFLFILPKFILYSVERIIFDNREILNFETTSQRLSTDIDKISAIESLESKWNTKIDIDKKD